jgi:hypothetical protein
MNTKNTWLPIFLFFILLAGNLLFFSGLPGTDDEQLFASAAQNLAITGRFSALQMYGNERVQGIYSNIAPLHPFIGSLIYHMAEWMGTGGLQCFFLLSPIYIALTGWLLAKIALKRGYSNKTIILGILAFGFTTIIFPYSKSFFREPLAMLLITSSYYAMDEATREELGTGQKNLRLVISFILLVAAIWTKEYLFVCIPFFILILFDQRQKIFSQEIFQQNQRKRVLYTGYIFLGFTLALLLLISQDASGRFSISYLTRLITYIPLLPHENFFQAIMGIFFSLSKGFLIYSPILLLVILYLYKKRWGKYRMELILAIGSAIGVAFLQAFVYDSQWWTFSWSTRFMLPIIPFWTLCLFPIFEEIYQKKKKKLQIFIFLLLFLGFFIQLGAMLVTDADYSQFIWENDQIRLSEVRISRIEAIPAIGHWLVVFRGAPIDIAWIRGLLFESFTALISPLIILLVSGLWVWFFLNKIEKLFFYKKMAELTIAISIILSLMVLIVFQDDPMYGKNISAYKETLEFLRENANENDQVIVDAYNHPLWYFYFNFGFPKNPWIGLSPARYSINGAYLFYPKINETVIYILQESKEYQNIWLIAEKKDTPIDESYLEKLKEEGFRAMLDSSFFIAGEWPLVDVIKLQ